MLGSCYTCHKCSDAHVPKQHICKLASYTSSKYSNCCLPSRGLDTEDLSGMAGWPGLIISVCAALRSMHVCSHAVASFAQSTCCLPQLCDRSRETDAGLQLKLLGVHLQAESFVDIRTVAGVAAPARSTSIYCCTAEAGGVTAPWCFCISASGQGNSGNS